MEQAERVEVLVLGSGAGGKLLSWDMARAGHRTAVVERRWVGGSCPNINCLPSKNEVRSAELADVVHHSGGFGTAATGVRTDMPRVLARKRRMVEGLVAMHLERYRASGVELSRVTVIERGPQVLGREDPDVAEALQRLFADEEIEVLLNAQVVRVEGRRGDLSVTVRAGGEEKTIPASEILAAAGRTPNTGGIGLDVAGIELDSRGYIAVDDRLETSAPGVWAIGECAGSPQFTHISENDYQVIKANLDGGNRSTRGRQVPFCVFTAPLARVGLKRSRRAATGSRSASQRNR